MAPHISLSELYNMKREKEKSKTISFDKVVELCHRRIRTIATYGGMNAFYEIPGMIVGYPLYNIFDCRQYLVESLRKTGFLVQILSPPQHNVVYISWDPEEIKPQKQQTQKVATLPAPAPRNRLRLF